MKTSHFSFTAAAILAAIGMNVLPASAACTAAPAGLVGWWKAENNAADTLGNHNGTLQGGLGFGPGKVGQAFQFDGADDYVDFGNWFDLQTFSIAMWVKAGASQQPYADIIDNNHTDSRSWVLQYDNTGLEFHWGVAQRGGVGFSFTPDTWQFLVITMDSNYVSRVYLDGIEQGSFTGAGPIPYDGSQFLRLSRWGGGGRHFNGQIDEFDIYNRALSSAELQGIYNAGSAGKCPPLPNTDDGFAPNPDGTVRVIAVDPQGRVIIGGAFTTVDGANRRNLARLHEDGTVDEAFNVPANDGVSALAVQADGKILVGGEFSTLGGQPRSGLARLHANGSLDLTFDPGVNDEVYCLLVQADGKILVGGGFTTLGGQARGHLGRLNADGSLDTGFIPEPDGGVSTLALQAGKILVGGGFTTLGGQPRSNLGRLNSDGSLDATFNPGADGVVSSLALQTDGKILVGGGFTTLGGQPRARIGRLHPNGSLDAGFNPGANDYVFRLAVQTDGKILVGGQFTILGGSSREHVGRLNADGSLEIGFNPGANNWVSSFALETGGRILVGGFFTTLGGQPRSGLGRLLPLPPTVESVTPANGTFADYGDPTLVSAVINDEDTAVDPASLKLMVDGADVTATSTITDTATGAMIEYQMGATPLGSPHTARVDFKDTTGAAGSATWAWNSSPYHLDNLFIETEDYNTDGGNYFPSNPGSGFAFNDKSLYNRLGAVHDTDYHNNGNPENDFYRIGEVPNIGLVDISSDVNVRGAGPRPGFDVQNDWKVGWNDAGDWFNYTRTFPAGLYNIYARLSSIVADRHAHLDLVADATVPEPQLLTRLGQFDAPRTGGWDTFSFVAMRTAAGALACVGLDGERTLRFTADPSNFDFDSNYLMLVPIAPPRLAIRREGANVVFSWTGGGVLQVADDVTGPWVDVPAATSPLTVPIDTTILRRFGRVICRNY